VLSLKQEFKYEEVLVNSLIFSLYFSSIEEDEENLISVKPKEDRQKFASSGSWCCTNISASLFLRLDQFNVLTVLTLIAFFVPIISRSLFVSSTKYEEELDRFGVFDE